VTSRLRVNAWQARLPGSLGSEEIAGTKWPRASDRPMVDTVQPHGLIPFRN
jgi:hypothetical protein